MLHYSTIDILIDCRGQIRYPQLVTLTLDLDDLPLIASHVLNFSIKLSTRILQLFLPTTLVMLVASNVVGGYQGEECHPWGLTP